MLCTINNNNNNNNNDSHVCNIFGGIDSAIRGGRGHTNVSPIGLYYHASKLALDDIDQSQQF